MTLDISSEEIVARINATREGSCPGDAGYYTGDC